LSETGSLVTASSSGESATNRAAAGDLRAPCYLGSMDELEPGAQVGYGIGVPVPQRTFVDAVRSIIS
jgi:hypothetical protein